MYNRIPRDDRYLLELQRFIETQYGFSVLSIAPARRGFFGETWRIQVKDQAYFAKIDFSSHKSIYRDSLPAVAYLNAGGIDFISIIVRASDGSLYKSFHNGIFCLFEWAEGESRENYPVARLFEKLAQIYKIPPNDRVMKRERFSTSCIRSFYANLRNVQLASDKASKDLAKILAEKEGVIHFRAERLEAFALACKSDNGHFHITHGDAGGNAILSGERFVIVDWDQPLLAPIERDAWFFLADAGNMSSIQHVLDIEGIDYHLQPDRLAFYAYYSFFYYLQEYLTCFFEAGKENQNELIDQVSSFFDGWIEGPIHACDN